MSTINYSIIIPHHNSPEKLERCVNSIPTREDIEVIIIDDNSSSTIVDFERFPGKNKENYKILLLKEGKGAGYARNQGLRHSHGKWIIFSDADDEFYTENLSFVMDKYIDSSVDIVYFNSDVINADTLAIENSRLEIYKHIDCNHPSDIEWFRYKLTVPWGKFVKKGLLSTYQITFDEVLAGNDVMFSLQSGHFAKQVVVDKTSIYKWYCYKKGNITSMISHEAVTSKFGVALRRFDFLSKNGKLQYRTNLFINYVPLFIKAGYPFTMSYYMVFKHIPRKYRLFDSISFMIFSAKKMFK